MERLTMTSDKGGLAFAFDLDITCSQSEMRKIYDLGMHLKAYEDTGKEPEEIKANMEMFAAYRHVCGGMSPEKVADALRRIAEDDKARKEGRLVELPCKVGDEVLATVQRLYNGNTATIRGVVRDIQTVARVVYGGDRFVDFLVSDFGKTVFLTRVLEAALGGDNHG